MAQEARLITAEDTLKALSEKATKDGDTFWVKVQRRAHMGSPPTVVATLSGAVLQHFTSPELWLPELCGGGKFLLQGSHDTEPGRQIGGSISIPIDSMEPREVSFEAVKAAGWRGPSELQFPKREAVRQPSADMHLYGVHSPPAPEPGNGASNKPPDTWARTAGGGFQRAQYSAGGEWQAGAAALEAERRSLEQIKLDLEKDKHKSELQGLAKQHEADMKALRAELLSELRSKPAGPDASNMLFMEFFKTMAEDRRAAAQQSAEDRRAAEARQAKADERFAMMIEKMSERKERDPLDTAKALVELVGTKKNDNEAVVKTMHSMMEMTSQMAGVSMEFIDQAARMQLGAGGADEPAWVKGVERLVKGFGSFAKARVGVPTPMPQAALPQPQAQALPGVVPVPVVPPQAAQPAQPTQPELPMIAQFEAAVKQKLDVKQVAAALIEHYNDPSIQQAFLEAGGDAEKAIYNRLGNWMNQSDENRTYMQSLMAELEKKLQEAGFFEAEESDGSDGDEEDADVGDEGEDE